MFVYRQEIDGLRSIAVIPVILYHAGLRTYFSGGYVGVDIFFVISGYLITSVIINECEEEKFSLINFYERRCRRILPALFLILFLSCFFSYYLMLPEQLAEFGESLISIICLNSNIYFWWKDDGYFSQISELNPLVHTWSLAVEEQFYFIFPLLCYLFYRKKNYFIVLLICFSLVSLILGQWGGNLESTISNKQFQMFSQHRFASFYLPIGRIWELLVGAFLAFYLQNNDSTKEFSHKFNQLSSLFGFTLIIISVVFFDNRLIPPFPNLYTLIPTCGAALIILCGNKNTLVGYLLSTRLLRWIGLISYSAYLWHQPLLAFLRLHSNHTSQILTLIIVAVVFPLSILSYLFVEQPFRDKKRFSQKEIFLITGLSTLITLCISLFLIRTANNRSLIINKGGDPYLSDLKQYGNAKYVVRNYDILLEKEKKSFSNKTSVLNRRIALVGDSFSQDFYNMIIEGKHLINFDICVHYVSASCQIYLGNEDRNRFTDAKDKQICPVHDIKLALPIIRQADIIILASNWYLWSAERLPNTLKLLNLTKQQQIFVIGLKHFGDVNPKLYVGKSRQFRIKQYQYPNREVIQINQLLEKTIDKSIFVNIQKLICTGINQTCPLFTPDGKLISHDGAHLTKYGAHFVGNIIFKNKPLNNLK